MPERTLLEWRPRRQPDLRSPVPATGRSTGTTDGTEPPSWPVRTTGRRFPGLYRLRWGHLVARRDSCGGLYELELVTPSIRSDRMWSVHPAAERFDDKRRKKLRLRESVLAWMAPRFAVDGAPSAAAAVGTDRRAPVGTIGDPSESLCVDTAHARDRCTSSDGSDGRAHIRLGEHRPARGERRWGWPVDSMCSSNQYR